MRYLVSILSVLTVMSACKTTSAVADSSVVNDFRSSRKVSVITLDGSKSTGAIKTVKWTQASGYYSKIDSPSNLVTKISITRIGIYFIRLTITDVLDRSVSAIKKITITK